jgi:hypothetical protein
LAAWAGRVAVRVIRERDRVFEAEANHMKAKKGEAPQQSENPPQENVSAKQLPHGVEGSLPEGKSKRRWKTSECWADHRRGGCDSIYRWTRDYCDAVEFAIRRSGKSLCA